MQTWVFIKLAWGRGWGASQHGAWVTGQAACAHPLWDVKGGHEDHGGGAVPGRGKGTVASGRDGGEVMHGVHHSLTGHARTLNHNMHRRWMCRHYATSTSWQCHHPPTHPPGTEPLPSSR